MPYGVGLIGAGPGVAALHAPTLARVADRFRIVHVSDAGSGRAAPIADRLGARSSSGEAELLADPDVDVVAICTPPREHARQILAAVEAGVRGILCEKPLAMDAEEAAVVVDACRAAGVVLVVGTNHLFDPAWGRATHHLGLFETPVRSVVVTASLPPNGRSHALVSEGAPPTAAGGPPGGGPDLSDPAVAAGIIRQLVLGLAVHDLPALRDLVPVLERVEYARVVAPIGYAIGATGSGVLVQLNAVMVPGGAEAMWRVAITTDDDRLDVDFPPSFVHDGSARVRVRESSGRVSEYPRVDDDGYIAEWRAVADMLEGAVAVEYDQILGDAHYAIALADAAARSARSGAPAAIAEGSLG